MASAVSITPCQAVLVLHSCLRGVFWGVTELVQHHFAILLITHARFFSPSTMTNLGWFKIFVGAFGGDLPQSLFLLSLVLHTMTFLPTLLLPKLTEGGMCRAWLMTDTRGNERSLWLPTLWPSLQAVKKSMGKIQLQVMLLPFSISQPGLYAQPGRGQIQT